MDNIFINIPVQDLEKSVAFYSELGFSIKPAFSDEYQRSIVWNDKIHVMLHTKEHFLKYSKKNVSKSDSINAYFTLPVDSLEILNKIVEKALTFGIQESSPIINEGFMQLRRIIDFDGHIWDIIYIDLNKFKALKQ